MLFTHTTMYSLLVCFVLYHMIIKWPAQRGDKKNSYTELQAEGVCSDEGGGGFHIKQYPYTGHTGRGKLK